MPWADASRAYQRARRERQNLSAASRQSVRYVLADLTGWLDGAPSAGTLRVKPPRQTPMHADALVILEAIDAWLAAHRAWCPSTVCTNLGFVRPFLEWAAGRGMCTGGVARMLTNPRQPKPIPRALPDAAIGRLLAVVPDSRGRAVVLLEAQCGLRRAEITKLVWPSDLDMAEGSLLVRGKGGVERVVWASPETLEALGVWLRERGSFPGPLICRLTTGAAFPQGVALSPTWVGIMVRRWLEAAGLKTMPRDGVSGHALRHSAATRLMRDGASLRVVQEALGHASITTTARYLRVDNAEVRAAMQAVAYGSRRLKAVDE